MSKNMFKNNALLGVLLFSLFSSFFCFSMAAFARSNHFNLEFSHIPNQLIVGFDNKIITTEAKKKLFSDLGGKITHSYPSIDSSLVLFAGKNEVRVLEQIARKLLKNPAVKYVEANSVIKLKSKIPNDPKFSESYGLHNLGKTGGELDADIDAPEAWDSTTGSRDVLVAVIDTGIDYNHPDLASNYWSNPGESGLDSLGRNKKNNGVDDDGNGFVDDFRGWDFVNDDNDPIDDHKHGTHCAGVIGGQGNDGVGITGVNWQVSLVAIKFLSSTGSGTLDHALRSVEYAVTLGVRITSNSWGGDSYSQAMHDVIEQANQSNVLFVAAAGNSGRDNDGKAHYPSSYNLANVIAVAATDDRDQLASFSNYGYSSVDLSAPGVSILSTVLSGEYKKLSGTSMATPYVSGAAALVLSKYPRTSASELKIRLTKTSEPLNQLRAKTSSGGRLNIRNALEQDSIPPGAIKSLKMQDQKLTSVLVNWNPAGDDGSAGRASNYDLRYSNSPVTTESEWLESRSLLYSKIESNNQVSSLIENLPLNTSGYLTIKPIDNVGNLGPFSKSAHLQSRPARMLYENLSDSLNQTEVSGLWGLEKLPAANTAFSDSPAGPYENNLESFLLLTIPASTSKESVVSFDTKYELEKKYDYLHVEVLTNEKNSVWVEVLKLTGESDWTMVTAALPLSLKRVKGIKNLRFRLVTDKSVAKEGVLIDNIRVYIPKK